MSDESDNLVLHHLRELRARMDEGFRTIDDRFGELDERLVKLELRMSDVEGLLRKTHVEVVSLSRRVGALERQRP
jgi:hypothetical protein